VDIVDVLVLVSNKGSNQRGGSGRKETRGPKTNYSRRSSYDGLTPYITLRPTSLKIHHLE
jgi:hypothetical protein